MRAGCRFVGVVKFNSLSSVPVSRQMGEHSSFQHYTIVESVQRPQIKLEQGVCMNANSDQR